MKNRSIPAANILSVDMGTSSVRACLVNPLLQVQHQSSQNLQLETNAQGKAEMDAEKVLKKTLICVQESLDWADSNSMSVTAISFSSASASLICLDADFIPIRPALTYADLRASKETQWLIENYGEKAFAHTATPLHASYWLPKLIWLKNHHLGNIENLNFCTIKDLLIYRLTGKFVIDSSNATALGMMDTRTMSWDKLSLDIAGIKESQLPKIRPTTTVFEIKNSQAESFLGIKQLPQVVLGAMDGVLASLGVGAYQPGQVTTTLGSSGACRITSAKAPLIGEQGDQRIWSYPLIKNIWIHGGAMNNGGLVTNWLTKNFSRNRTTSRKAFQEILETAGKICPGSDGLLFLPYLFGERAPIYDEHARGVYFGLHSEHSRGYFARAGFEGILYALYSIYEILRPSVDHVVDIWASGGYIQSDLMLQIQADIFGQSIRIPSERESSVIGAAALGFLALGIITKFDELGEYFSIENQFIPNEASHRIYKENYLRFKALYESLAPLF
jgi:gluconokinase